MAAFAGELETFGRHGRSPLALPRPSGEVGARARPYRTIALTPASPMIARPPPGSRKASAGLSEQHRKLARSAHGALRPGDPSGGVEPEIRYSLQPFLDSDRHFHAREVGADAAMDAEAERSVAVFLAVDHDLVGIREHRGIAVGGGKRQQHHVAGLDGAAADD